MLLDYVDKTRKFILKVPRTDRLLTQQIMNEHGWDFSRTASGIFEAVLFSNEPYAAAAFAENATPEARAQIQWILDEVAASGRPESQSKFRMPHDRELWGFQRANLDYALRRTHTLIADEPGLGKTPTAIVYANEVRARKVLVVCPAAVRLQWEKKVREWSTMPWPYIVHTILHRRRGVHDGAHWTIVSYDLASIPEIGGQLAKQFYDVLILDEAHYLKELSAKRTRAVFGGGRERIHEPLIERAKYVLALTGTPLPNRPREAYALARALHWESIDFLSEDGFKDRFNPSIKRQVTDRRTGLVKTVIDERSGRHAELQTRLRANFMTRHEKHGPRGVMKQLHMPIFDLIHVEADGAVKQALKAEKLLDIDPENLSGADATALGHVAEVRRMMGIAMAPQVARYIDMLIENGEEKLTVFAWHKEVMNYLEKHWHKHGCVRIDGSTSAKGRLDAITTFQENRGCRVILGNLLSMGVGVDGLQNVCSHGLIAEPDWVPGNNIQAFDRLDRGGQREQVQADIFVAPGSFAEKVLASALRKAQTIHSVLDRRMGG